MCSSNEVPSITQHVCAVVVLAMNLRENFTITEKVPTRVFAEKISSKQGVRERA